MKVIHKSYKFKIAPDNEQKELLAKHFGACRFVFNRYLNSRKETYLEEKKSLNYYDCCTTLRGEMRRGRGPSAIYQEASRSRNCRTSRAVME